MEDNKIIELFIDRSEQAIAETAEKYGTFCKMIAYNILRDHGESDECVNDTYLSLWNSIPPQIPQVLKSYTGKITRNKALHIYEKKNRMKRHADIVDAVLNELEDCVDMTADVEYDSEKREIQTVLIEFLDGLEKEKRVVFVMRYWYMMTEKEIAEKRSLSVSNVKIILHRLRKELKSFFIKNEMF